MSKIYEFPPQDTLHRETLHDEASLWIAKLDRQLSASEEDALKQWIAQSPQHRALLFHMAEIWDRMDSLARLSSLFPPPIKARTSLAFARFFSFAASMFVAIGAAIWGMEMYSPNTGHDWLSWHTSPPLDAAYETNIGEHSTVNLPDGTQLILNTDSLIKVRYTKNARLFHLLRGEAHIEVAHDGARPLRVMALDKVVQALGTAFNLQIFSSQQVELIVTEGKVLVAKSDKGGRFEALEKVLVPNSSTALSKGEKIVLGGQAEGREIVAQIASHEIEANLSWRKGHLTFHGETLEEALREISRYTEVEFEIIDDEIKDVRIAGLFKAGDVNGLLSTLEKNFQIHYIKLGPERVRLAGAAQEQSR